MMGYEWSDREYAALPEAVQKGRALLEDWFQAMERGDAHHRQPDPFHEPEITAEIADKVIARIDAQFEHELKTWAHQPAAGAYTHGPEFWRLETPQRIALAQQMRSIIKASKNGAEPDPQE